MNKCLSFVLFLFISCAAISQKEDYVWRIGNNGGINFNSGQADTFSTQLKRPFTFDAADASICDSAGNLLFFTNGVALFNAAEDTMLNGDSLNPSSYTTNFAQVGLRIPKAGIILRKPGNPTLYYLFHETIDDLSNN